MLSAKDISDRLLRLEFVLSNAADDIIGMKKQMDEMRRDLDAYRKQESAEANARHSEWLDTEWQGEAEQEGST